MIEINLVPGSGKKAKKGSGGAKLNVGAQTLLLSTWKDETGMEQCRLER